jgi:hypothetical protein
MRSEVQRKFSPNNQDQALQEKLLQEKLPRFGVFSFDLHKK